MEKRMLSGAAERKLKKEKEAKVAALVQQIPSFSKFFKKQVKEEDDGLRPTVSSGDAALPPEDKRDGACTASQPSQQICASQSSREDSSQSGDHNSLTPVGLLEVVHLWGKKMTERPNVVVTTLQPIQTQREIANLWRKKMTELNMAVTILQAYRGMKTTPGGTLLQILHFGELSLVIE
ncbi:hypothetical protein ABVT39_002835 [Epinephelus coioides]